MNYQVFLDSSFSKKLKLQLVKPIDSLDDKN